MGANLPFRSVAHGEFKHLVELLRPGYKPPNRKAVASELLDAVYHQELQKASVHLQGQYATLQIDGWTSPGSDPVLATAVCVGQKSYLLSAEDTNGQPHTAEWLAERLLVAIDTAERDMVCHWSMYHLNGTIPQKCRVIAVASDSASNMKRMRDLVQEKRPDLLYIPCMAHWLNLAAKDIAEDSTIIEKVTLVLKWFRNNHKAHAALRAKRMDVPPTACDTRWSSNFKLVEYYNRHWGSLADICSTILRPGEPVRVHLENTQIRRGSEDLAVQVWEKIKKILLHPP